MTVKRIDEYDQSRDNLSDVTPEERQDIYLFVKNVVIPDLKQRGMDSSKLENAILEYELKNNPHETV